MIKESKKSMSGIIISVLLILLVVSLASFVMVFSKNYLEKIKKESAAEKAKAECEKIYKVQVESCLNKEENKVKIDLVNLDAEIPSGSLIQYESTFSILLKPLIMLDKPIAQGGGISFDINEDPEIFNFTSFGLEKIKIVPIYTIGGIRVMCRELESVEVKQC
jgi:hypothetical protein